MKKENCRIAEESRKSLPLVRLGNVQTQNQNQHTVIGKSDFQAVIIVNQSNSKGFNAAAKWFALQLFLSANA